MYRLDKFSTLAFLALFLATIIVWCDGFTLVQFVSADAHDYAQMGREIRSGNGFSSLQLFPRHITYLDQRGLLESEHIPNLYRYPLPTLANAFFLLFTSDAARAAVMQTGVSFLLSIPVFFMLARHITNGALAFLCTTLYVANPWFWSFSRSGLTESLAILLLLSAALIIFPSNMTHVRLRAFFTGAISALAVLTRSQLVYLYPLSLLYYVTVAQTKDRTRSPSSVSLMTLATAGFLLSLSPWAVRNMTLTGDPLFSFSSSRSLALATRPLHSDLDMQLHAPADTAAVLSEHGTAIWKKSVGNIWPAILNPISWTSSAPFALCLWIVLVASRITKGALKTDTTRRFDWSCALMLACNFLILCPTFSQPRFNQILHPFIIILTVGHVSLLIRTIPQGVGRNITFATMYLAALLIGIVHCGKRLSEHHKLPPGEKGLGGLCEALSDRMPGHGIVASDVSHKISLHCRVLTTRLPGEPTELLEISERYIPIDRVVLTPRLLRDRQHASRSWWETYDTYPAFIASKEFARRYEPSTTLPNGVVIFRRRS